MKTIDRQYKHLRKTLLFFVFACMLFPQISFSQGMEFLWAKKLGGGSISEINPILIDKINSAVMDSMGNTYVFGTFGAHSKLDDEFVNPSNLPQYAKDNIIGVFVAKFDTLGNLLWKKCSRSRENKTLIPMSMILKNNELTIAFYGTIGPSVPTNWFFFFDTIIHQELFQPLDSPYALNLSVPITYTFFVNFDLDGNVTESHYIDNRYLRLYPDSRFVIDDQNNICLFASFAENENPSFRWSPTNLPHLVVDGDTTKRFMFDFYDGDTTKPHREQFFSFLKFDTNWNVVAYKRLIDTFTNTSFDLEAAEGRTYEAWPKEMSLHIDEDNNMYVSGLMHAAFSLQDTAVHYYINLDSAHHLTVESALGAYNGIPFIIKYDPDGNVIWSQQLYFQSLRSYNDWSIYHSQSFGGMESGRVYFEVNFESDSYAFLGVTDSIYEAYLFFDENHKLPIETSGFSERYAICIAYDKMNGSLLDYFQYEDQNDGALLAAQTPMIIDSNYFRTSLAFGEPDPPHVYGSVWYTRNRKTSEIIKTDTIFDLYHNSWNLVHPHGFVLRIGDGHHLYNDYFDFSGNYITAIVLYYDSTLDCRRQPVIIPQDSTSISSASSPQFTLFPNPASSLVRVIDARTGNFMPDITEISIISMQGKKILSLPNTSQFDVSALPNAPYIVKISTSNTPPVYLKLLKQ